MESTESISKGVFVFKNGFKKTNKRGKAKNTAAECNSNPFNHNLWYQTYKTLWNTVQKQIQDLNDEMFACILSSLVSFVTSSHQMLVNEVPAAILLTGINMPDHAAQFTTLAKEIRYQVTPHVACLSAQDCQNLKQLVEHLVDVFVNKEECSSDDDLSESEDEKRKIRKSNCNFALLQAWYEDLYGTEPTGSSPKKRKSKTTRKPLVVIIPEFEGFSEKILQSFILILSSYVNVLPFVLVFGIATSLTALHRSLPYHVSSKINMQVFNSQPSTAYLSNVLEHVFFTDEFPFHLGGKVFNLFTDIFLFYDLSVTGFIRNYKYAMLEHFCTGNSTALCTKLKDVSNVLDQLKHEDFESVRHLMSFRLLVERETPKNQIKLLTDDAYLSTVLLEEITNIHEYVRKFFVFLKSLQILTCDLPKAPLGKQLRELYSIAASKNITGTEDYKHCFQLLSFLSKEELCAKISKIEDIITTELRRNKKGGEEELEEFVNKLRVYVNNLNVAGFDDAEEESVEDEQPEDAFSEKMDRQTLKNKLLQMSKKPKPLNKYEKLRYSLLEFLSAAFKEHLREPSSNYFHELFFFNDLSIQNHIVGVHRAAIHTALNDPHSYLQCSCCEIPNDSVILRTMPDICIAYKLHLEAGKMINLYDWLQAFLAVLDPSDADDDKRIVDPQLQARFTQAIAELEFLGFIKSSKRKTDHVARLTWGG